MSTTVLALQVLAALPDPGAGAAPPGSGGFNTLLSWLKWICYGIAIAGAMVAGAKMVFGGGRGDGGEHASRLGYVGGGALVIASAAAIIGGLIGTQTGA